MKDFVEFVAKGLVDKPEDVQVVRWKGTGRRPELRVAKEDLGKVIGKQGRTARALRTLLGAASSKAHRRVMLEIVE
ncbi:MAG: KH domain-containing protein [Bilophila wadsworthia]